MPVQKRNLLDNVIAACRHTWYVTGLFSLIINLFMLVSPIYMLQLYDRVITSHSYDTLIYLTIIAVIAMMIQGLIDMARSRILVHLGTWLDNSLSPAALLKSPDELLRGSSYGSQALRDITNVRQFLAGAGMITLFDSPWVPIYLFVIFMLHPYLGIFATISAVVLFVLAVWNELLTRKFLSAANTENILAQQFIDTSLRNPEIIQAMGMMPNVIKHWKRISSPVLEMQSVASNVAGMILSTTKFMRICVQIGMLALGAYLVIIGELTGGAMMAGSILLGRALAPVEQALGVWKQLVSARQAYFRLKNHFHQDLRTSTEISLPEPKGFLSLQNVMYRVMTREQPILMNISLQLKPGEILALIGNSGVGKSTLARIIVGAVKATVGDVRLDGADIYSWDREEIGKYIGYLPQDIELMPGSIKDNIARMGEIDDEAVIDAAKISGVHEMILRLPKGYDTLINEVGLYSLSGGQRQRIALARAVYKNPKLILLDEPNSNLDAEGEQALLATLVTMKNKGAAQIIISHRQTILSQVDYIMMLRDGKVMLYGPRDRILEELQKMAQAQQLAQQNKV